MNFAFSSSRRRIWAAAALTVAIAAMDWRVDAPIAFGFLYLFPVLLVGTVLERWQVVCTALLCTLLADLFDPYSFSATVSLPQDILVFAALAGTGLFAFELTRSRRTEVENVQRLERESRARRAAEEQLEFLISSSPVAILTADGEGHVILANSAAHRLFDIPAGTFAGRSITRYVPALGRVPLEEGAHSFHTEMECRGERENGEVFIANVFFSTYKTASGPRLAALVVDTSEELREREESNLEQLMAGSRILVGAVSHEVRNVCGAIGVIYENLARGGTLQANKDFDALGSLVETLNKIASMELKQSAGASEAGPVDLREIIEDLRIVLEPVCEEAGIVTSWHVPPRTPAVWADRHRLMQVLLNLTKNSVRALESSEMKRIDISVSLRSGSVSVRVADTGPGIETPGKLFQPFQKGAESTGLGLFLSRAFARSFHADLRYDPSAPGCAFIIDLNAAGPRDPEVRDSPRHGKQNQTVAR